MLLDIDKEAENTGLQMNYEKTKTMTHTDENSMITAGYKRIEQYQNTYTSDKCYR